MPARTEFSSTFRAGLASLAALAFLALPAASWATTTAITCGTTTVVNGVTVCNGSPTSLSSAMANAADGDVITVGPGTYAAAGAGLNSGADFFQIARNITVVSTGGAGVTFLQGTTTTAAYVVRVYRIGGSNPNGAVLDGFTLQHSDGGVEVNDFINSSAVIDGVTLRNLVFNPTTPLAGGSHGISLVNATNTVIDNVTVSNSQNNGISIASTGNPVNCSNDYVINSRIQGAANLHAIGITACSNITIAGNTITGSGNDGIIALGVTNSRFERNTISGHRFDGITLTPNGTTPSTGNFVGFNRIVSNGWNGGVDADGSGVWLNGADGNLVFGNDLSGSPETGIPIFAGRSNYIQANRVHGNFQGGMLVWNTTSLSGGVGGRPTDTFVHNNFIYNNPMNAMVILRDATRNDIGFNNFWGGNFPGDTANPTHQPGSGAGYTASPGGVASANFTASPNPVDAQVYSNTIYSMVNSFYFDTGTTGTTVSRNRMFGAMSQYSNAPATVNWDNGSSMGGNFWNFFAANGNPSTGATPFTNIFCPTAVGCAAYQDHYPFAGESLGQARSIVVNLPRALSSVAAGSTKTIQWDSRGCTLVDLDLMSGTTPVLAIASNYPDTGYFVWSVPSGQAAGSYAVRVTCKNSAGAAVGYSATGSAFSIFAAGLTLLTPGPYSAPTGGGTTLVSWARGAGVTGAVTVWMSLDGGIEFVLASGVTGDSVSVTLPASNSNRAAIRIVTGANQDSTDGYFGLARTTGFGPTLAASQKFTYGSVVKLEWTTHPSSRYVDIQIFNGSTYEFVAHNVPDFGHYEYLVPQRLQGTARNFRLTYKTAASETASGIAQATSNNFDIVGGTDLSVSMSAPSNGSTGKDVMYTIVVGNNGPSSATATGVTVTYALAIGHAFIWASSGCTNGGGVVTCSVGSLAQGANATLQIVTRPSSAGLSITSANVTSGVTDTVPGNNSASAAVTVSTSPVATQVLRYRLFSPGTQEHLYTTDLNEYTVLGASGAWNQEGTVGKVLSNPGSFGGVTATPYYRLYNSTTHWHHWTTDANEYYTLIQFAPVWNGEGVDGYILPTPATGATQLFRLLYPDGRGLHHWTIDANEYNTLINTYGWIGEGGSGYVIQ
jgi:parallel beta-helix repeat protein